MYGLYLTTVMNGKPHVDTPRDALDRQISDLGTTVPGCEIDKANPTRPIRIRPLARPVAVGRGRSFVRSVGQKRFVELGQGDLEVGRRRRRRRLCLSGSGWNPCLLAVSKPMSV